MKKIFFVVSILALFSSCEQEENNITLVLDWTVNTNHTGLFVAQEKGYFAEQGLKVEILSPPEIGAETLLLGGRADFVVSYQEGVTFAAAENRPLVAIAAILQHNTSGFASLKSSNITNPKDFEDKVYGGWGSPMEEATIRFLMESYQGEFERTVFQNIGSMNFLGAMENEIDYAWIFWGWDGIAAELKGVELNYLGLKDVDPIFDYYTPVLATRKDLLEEHPEMVKKFLKAVTQGYEWTIENPKQAGDILLELFPELDRDLVIASSEYLSDFYQGNSPRWGEMDIKRWEIYTQWLYDHGFIDNKPNSQNLFTNEFLPQ